MKTKCQKKENIRNIAKIQIIYLHWIFHFRLNLFCDLTLQQIYPNDQIAPTEMQKGRTKFGSFCVTKLPSYGQPFYSVLLYTPNNTKILTAVNISDELSFEDIGEMAKIWQLSNISVDSDGKEKSTTDCITNLFLFSVMYQHHNRYYYSRSLHCNSSDSIIYVYLLSF